VALFRNAGIRLKLTGPPEGGTTIHGLWTAERCAGVEVKREAESIGAAFGIRNSARERSGRIEDDFE
jgi:hypothetical protein